jgi:UDP-4-amino-4,6-dideoxy-N-acetyl-beta-L-altrosamine transaminase
MSNGTATLHCASKALGLGPGDYLWTSPITFVASANAAFYCGAEVDFVDIDPRTALMCAGQLERKLARAERDGRLPKIVVPVHFAGQSCDMPRIFELSQKYGFKVIEDAAHALGGEFCGKRVGGCEWSDATSHSFHPVKIITCGEGGMITTNNPELAQRLELLRSHGITRDGHLMEGAIQGGWYYEQVDLGFNYRMTDIQAALGLSQMDKLEVFSKRRREIADLYDRELLGLPVTPLFRDSRGVSGWHLYVVRLNLNAIGKSRGEIFEGMRASGIGVNVHYIPVHLQPFYRKKGFSEGMFPEAERYYREAITLPLFPKMSESDVSRVKDVLAAVVNV